MKKLLSVLLVAFFVSSGIAYAQGFTLQSCKGKWGVNGIYGDNEGALVAVMTADVIGGEGIITEAKGTINLPGLLGGRNIMEATFTGDYAVNPDGTCSATFVAEYTNGMVLELSSDCVIMQADESKLATEIFCMRKEPLNITRGIKRGGILIMTLKRLPE